MEGDEQNETAQRPPQILLSSADILDLPGPAWARATYSGRTQESKCHLIKKAAAAGRL